MKRRGFASGLAVSGIGVGTLIMPPLAAVAVGLLGWRHAYLALGILATVVGVGMALLIENDPRDRGLAPDGDPKPKANATPATPATTPNTCLRFMLVSSLGWRQVQARRLVRIYAVQARYCRRAAA